MFPYLINTSLFGFPISVATYGVLLATAFALAYWLNAKRAVERGESMTHVREQILFIGIASLVGGRLFHVILEDFSAYAANPVSVFQLRDGGFTIYGALLASILAVIYFCRKRNLDFFRWGDIAAPAIALGIAIGRIGCFFAGCCWGKPTSGPMGVTYSHPETFAGVTGVAVHPSQLYEAFGCLVLLAYLLWREKRQKYVGEMLVHLLLGYAILRFIVEIFRGDEYRGYVFGIVSYSQLISLGVFAVALAGLFYLPKRELKPNARTGRPAKKH